MKSTYNLVLLTLLVFGSIITSSGQSSWNLNGNTGSNPATNFIGNTDNKAFVLRTNNKERMRIASSGNVGVGTAAPGAKLHVNGTVKISDGTQGAGKVLTSDANGMASWQTPTSGIGGSGAANFVSKFTGANTLSNSSIYDDGTHVGIGTTASNCPLSVYGSGNAAGNFFNSAISVNNYGVSGACANTADFGIGVYGSGGNTGISGSANMPGTGYRYGSNNYGANGDFNFGSSCTASGGTTAYGIYANAYGATDNWAGYFGNGNVYVQNKLGIGNLSPVYTVDATGNGIVVGNFINNSTNASFNYGVFGSCNNTPSYGIGIDGNGGQVGVWGTANLSGPGEREGLIGIAENGAAFNYGVYSYGQGGLNAFGIFAAATGGSNSTYAGYFSGNVYATGVFTSSDRKLKSDIQPVTNALSIINKLNPSVYTFKTKEFSQMNLPEGIHYGLIADEVQQVMPDAVKKAVQPEKYENYDKRKGKKLSDVVEFNAVNYTEMIPVLIAAVKEQQAQIEEQKTEDGKQKIEIEELKAQIASLQSSTTNGNARISFSDDSNTFLLGQNIPNPAENNTVIPYHIPNNCNSASIVISETGSGKFIKTIPVSCSETHLAIGAGTLASGTYTYTLLVDGKSVDSKQMILAK